MPSAAVDALMRVALFEDVESSELQSIAECMRKRVFQAGDTVTAEGGEPDGFFVVESGEAEVVVQGQRRGTITTGDCFGEIALLMGAERMATITAISDLHCYGLAPSEFRELVEGNPSIAWRLYESMADRIW